MNEGPALVFDPFAGVAGDMTIAALLDLGLPLDWLRGFIGGLGVGDVRLDAERVDRKGIACTYLRLELPDPAGHRHLSDILEVIDQADLSERTRTRATEAFTRLADAEAAVHGTTREAVHFHEVGALDAIVDVLGVMGAVEHLGFERFYTRPVALGRGWSRMEHGLYPVPPPAALNLLRGIPVTDPPFDGECTTPTGAALVATLSGGAAPPGSFSVDAVGFGAGTRNDADRPNCLRLVAVRESAGMDRVRIMQADLDDMSPEYLPPLLDELREVGAIDVFSYPVGMKKGRIGVRLEVLVDAASAQGVSETILRSTTTLGLRFWDVDRERLHRTEETVHWQGHAIRVKRALRPGGRSTTKPEYEDIVRIARETGRSANDVYNAVLSAIGDGLES